MRRWSRRRGCNHTPLEHLKHSQKIKRLNWTHFIQTRIILSEHIKHWGNDDNSDVSDNGTSCPEDTVSTVSESLDTDDTDAVECIDLADSMIDPQTKMLEGLCRSHQVKECNPLLYNLVLSTIHLLKHVQYASWMLH